MTWASPKVSPTMTVYPRTLARIVVTVGGLAFFLIFASWILVSHPIGSTVRGYFYGVDNSEKVDWSTSPGNQTTINHRHDNNVEAESDLQESTSSTSPTKGTVEVIDKDLASGTNSQVLVSTNHGPVVPTASEKTDVEASLPRLSNSQPSARSNDLFSVENKTEVVDENLPPESNSQVPMSSPSPNVAMQNTAPFPASSSLLKKEDGAKPCSDSSNFTKNAENKGPISLSLLDKSNVTEMGSNDSTISSDPKSGAEESIYSLPSNVTENISVDSGTHSFCFEQVLRPLLFIEMNYHLQYLVELISWSIYLNGGLQILNYHDTWLLCVPVC